MSVQAFRIFYVFVLVYFVAPIWISSPYLGLGVFVTALAGSIWSLAPVWFQQPLSSARALMPLIMLAIFLLLLISTPQKSMTVALIGTAAGLLLFRTLRHLLQQIQHSKKATLFVVKMLVIAIIIEVMFRVIEVYSTFRLVPSVVLDTSHLLSVRVFSVLFAWGWISEPTFQKNEKQFGLFFLLGLIHPYASAIGWMAATLLFLKSRGMLTRHEIE